MGEVRVPILKQGDILIASVQDSLTDEDLAHLRDDLATMVGMHRARGVVVDVTPLDVLDSFATRTFQEIARSSHLRGATTVIAGIQPNVAFSMVQLGLTLHEIDTVLDLEEALSRLQRNKIDKQDKRRNGRR